MGRQYSKKGANLLYWLKKHPGGVFEQYNDELPGAVTKNFFEHFKSNARSKGTIPKVPRDIVKCAPRKPRDYAAEKAKRDALKDNNNEGASFFAENPIHELKMFSDDVAAKILECAVNTWLTKNPALIQLRTITNNMLTEFNYIKNKAKR